jgi:hypothetical protein
MWTAPAERSVDGALDFDFESRLIIQSGVAPDKSGLPPHSKDAHDSGFAFEVLQSGNLAVAAALVPV